MTTLMKLLFLHISDIHFKNNSDALYEINIPAISSSLSEIGDFNEVVLIFSGDIAFSGDTNQYSLAEQFINKLKLHIRKKYDFQKKIYTMIVPGNHDNFVKDFNRDLKAIREYHSSDTVSHFYEDIQELKNFFSFAKKFSCFVKNHILEVVKLQFGKFIIKFNLINTAPFSLISDSNDDKGVHYLPSREFTKFDFERGENFTVSIMHHSPEWFCDDSKKMLYQKLYSTSDLIFIGHEHFPLAEKKIIDSKYNVIVSNGVALYGTNTEQGFNAIILNTSTKSIHGMKFIYDGSKYCATRNIEERDAIFKGRYKFTANKKFNDFIETDMGELSGERYLQYFVFPSLESADIRGEAKNFRISSEEKFLEFWKSKKIIVIEGGNKSGKTILSKYICHLMLTDYVPLYLTEEDFAIKNNRRLLSEKLIEQFGISSNIDEYLNLTKERRVLIVDGYDLINKTRWNHFWNEHKNNFELILMFSSLSWNFNLKEKSIEELSEMKPYYLKICPFYYEKRGKFIKKICQHTGRTIQNIDEKAWKINEDITNQIEYFQLTPEFIFQYVNCYLSFPLESNSDSGNIFNKVYEANITMRLVESAGEESISDIMMVLEYAGYYAHFNSRYPFSREEFENCVNQYNNDYDNNINAKFALNKAISARILKETNIGFSLVFCDENLLAYFVALHLNRLLLENKGHNDLKYVLENICFRPNGDIFLFLSYITNNVNVLNPIFQSIYNLMSSWDELDFDARNIHYLDKVSISKATAPTDHEKEKLTKTKDTLERHVIEKQKNEPESLYSQDKAKSDSFDNKISKGIYYLNLIAKILPNFRSFLKGEQKKEIVTILYRYSNRLLYFMLKDINSNYEQIIDDIMSLNPVTRKGMLVTKNMVENTVKRTSIAFILSVYNFIAETVSNKKTIVDLNKETYFELNKNSNYRLMNLLMEESAGRFSQMIKKAEDLKRDASLEIVRGIIPMIIRKYFLCHDVPQNRERQRVIDTFFDKEEKRAIQMAQYQNKTTKK